ncbi:MetQ/NlpA family ABC transporter substrate-binding protein [Bifidobacterium psychraerophilum]|uniref:Lipoprotein n=1 Tax=Bifidobacterium psychraerophilum TaxID=218140 RepID=A0A087CGP0_9BIFI|nr:MetQ/NlpA family ABC transporter substrate-binding protein [Bifidobacterium psychraerophilum]KFI82440.1 Methionine ABC transporter substrate-binding protein [Bifidobacterium psychraerophilum]PKA95241.1 D-methionine transport system substrate-binding protein [Bifidobacterium psychraerophilum DSM 22366]
MKKKILAGALAIITSLSLAACGSSSSSEESHDYVVGVASDQQKEIWEYVGDQVKKEGITIDVKLFSGYTEENPALVDGSLDLNSFQHVAFLNNFNKENNADLVPIGYTLISPFGLYSDKIKDYKDLKDGDTVAIPNDVTNGGRALQLLDAIGVIKLKSDAPDSPTTKDIASYVKKITIKELQADQIAAALPDVTAATINTNYVTDQLHTTPKDSAIYIDTDHIDKVNEIYRNVIAVRKEDKDKADFKKIVKAYQSDAVAKLIEKTNDIPAW